MRPTISPAAGHPYGVALTCRVLEIPRSTVYATQALELNPTPPLKRSPMAAWCAAELTETIRKALENSPWLGERIARCGLGCARGIHTSKARVRGPGGDPAPT